MKNISWKQFGVFSLILIGIILAFSPISKNKTSVTSAEKIAKQIENREDHISAEKLGQMIIDKEPGFLVIDVRNEEDYKNFHIEPSINIPLPKLFEPEILNNLDPEKLLVLYSNGGTHAAQAWVLLQQKGFKYSTVLLGGLNYWVDVYSNPEPPEGEYADHDMFRYQFLKSAGSKLLGNTQTLESPNEEKKPLELKLPQRKKRKKSADEGC